MPRSATTLCYSLLTADSQNFSSMKLWEILFAPSVIQKKFLLLVKKIDALINSPLYKSLKRFDRFFFRGIEDIHPISLFNYEEDDYLFTHVFTTLSVNFIFPDNKRILLLKQFDEKISERGKRFLMRYYLNCIKRHLFVFGGGKRYLAKSPTHSSKIRTLLRYFPESRFIYMLRDPYYTIASTVCLFRRMKNFFCVEMEIEAIIPQIIMLADTWYGYPLISCKPLLGKSIFVLPFNELTKNSIRAVELIYFYLGLELSNDYKKFLKHADALSKRHKTTNHYTPEEFGLNEQVISKRYHFIYEDYFKNTAQQILI
jgi:hypothetical protein